MGAFDIPDFAPSLRTLEDTARGEKWARSALASEAAMVAGAANGTRNAALNNAALKMGHKVAGGYLSASDVEAALLAAAAQSGLAQEDGRDATLATIRSGLTAGTQEPEHPQDRPDYQRQPEHRAKAVIPQPERASTFYSAASLEGRPVPDREWMVHGLVPMNNVTLFSGDGGTGKSLLALQLAVAATAGTDWLANGVKRGRVIFLSAEDDDDELHRRLDAILRAEGRAYRDATGLTLRSLAGEDALLAIEGQVSLLESALFEELDKRAADDAPALIIIDTLADVYPSNENDRGKVRQFIGILRGLSLRHKCAVMLLGHPSLTGLGSGTGTSGSTAWNNSVRSRLYLERIVQDGYEPNPDARIMSTKKANHGRIGGQVNMSWDAGVFVADAIPTGLDRLAAGAAAERVFLKLLDELKTQGRYVSSSPGPTYAPAIFAKHPHAEGMTKRALSGAMETMLCKGALVTAKHGRGAKERSHIERHPGDAFNG